MPFYFHLFRPFPTSLEIPTAVRSARATLDNNYDGFMLFSCPAES